MPKLDRTFNATDVIRIVDKHLTKIERDEVILILCKLFEESEILKLLRIALDAVDMINDIIKPAVKWLARVPFLKRVITVLEVTEVILKVLIVLVEFFESLERSG
jgi:hypothetical protein